MISLIANISFSVNVVSLILSSVELTFPVFHHINTPNGNMADYSVVAWDEVHESEVSQSSMICFENA